MKKSKRLIQNGIDPKHFSRGQLKLYAFLIPVCLFMALPILYIIINAFKPMEELFAYPPRFFVRHPTMSNFKNFFNATTNIPISRYLFNSIITTALMMLASLYMSVSAAYVLSKKRFKLRNVMMEINNLALMFVSVAVSIPRYFVIVFTGLQNNYLVSIIPLLAMPVGLFLVKQFIDQIPEALVEAAVVEGASDFTILRRIIIPLVKPALSTVAILAFQTSWNNVESSTMYIDNQTFKNLAFYVSTLSNAQGNTVAGAGAAAAGALIMFLPNLILFIILQSQVMNTMTHSGIK